LVGIVLGAGGTYKLHLLDFYPQLDTSRKRLTRNVSFSIILEWTFT
jgi:hypothetical protein